MGDAALLQPLVEAVGMHDGSSEHYTVDDIADELSAPGLALEQDSLLGIDPDGRAIAWGWVLIAPGDVTLLRAGCDGGVHPAVRGRGIGRALLAWQLDRARALAAARRAALAGSDGGGAPDVPGRAFVRIEDGAPDAARLATRTGLELTRWFTLMRRPLGGDLPVPTSTPAGLRVVNWSRDLDDAVRLAHNEAFTDHWGFQPWTTDTWDQWQSGHRSFRPDWSFVVLDGTEVAGYVLNAAWTQEWEFQGFTEGWTNKLGVRRPWRGRGLAKNLLAVSMRAFADSGMESAALDVDSENHTGAVALYEGLGYRPAHRTATWTVPV